MTKPAYRRMPDIAAPRGELMRRNAHLRGALTKARTELADCKRRLASLEHRWSLLGGAE